jgi:hypothetical protein
MQLRARKNNPPFHRPPSTSLQAGSELSSDSEMPQETPRERRRRLFENSRR